MRQIPLADDVSELKQLLANFTSAIELASKTHGALVSTARSQYKARMKTLKDQETK
jgi:hypothetical protein